MLKFNISPKKKFKLNLYFVYLIPVVTGLIARVMFYPRWFKSPFHYYHIIVGLDMRKFLIFGEKFYHGNEPFSPYRLFIAVIYGIFGSDILPEAVILGQLILGLVTVFLTVYITLSISGNRLTSVIAGIFMALYSPVIIYETQILKASLFLFVALLSLATLLYARKKQFASFPMFISGVFAILPLFIRHAGFLWLLTAFCWLTFYARMKVLQKCGICFVGINKTYKNFKPLLYFIAGSLSFLIIVTIYNKSRDFDTLSYFKPNYSYVLAVGADEESNISVAEKTVSKPSVSISKAINKFQHYLTKAFNLFNAYEIPNNINYYYVQKKLPITRFFIGPVLLMPLALTGLILMIINGGLYKKESILFFYIVSFAIPICAFLPLGRYKLVLAPVFCIAAAYCLMNLLKIVNRKGNTLNNIVTPALLAVFFFLAISRVEYPERASDHKSYGIAASYIPDQLMQQGKFDEACRILADYYAANQDNNIIGLNYASSLLGCGRIKDAEFVLNLMGIPEDGNLCARYFYESGETYRLLNEREKALQCYNEVLRMPCSEQRKNLTRKRMNELF